MIYWYFGADINIVIMIKAHPTQFTIGSNFGIFIIFLSLCREVDLVLRPHWLSASGVFTVGLPLLCLTFPKVALLRLTFQKQPICFDRHAITEWHNLFLRRAALPWKIKHFEFVKALCSMKICLVINVF